MKWDGHGRSVSSRGFGKTLNRGPSAGQAEEEGSRQGPQSEHVPGTGCVQRAAGSPARWGGGR